MLAIWEYELVIILVISKLPTAGNLGFGNLEVINFYLQLIYLDFTS